MQLKQLILAINEKTLPREALEAYGDQLSSLFAQMMVEKSELEKQEALFLHDKGNVVSVAQRKIEWKATREGQRLIELKNYLLATKEMINSLKSRVYRLIY